MKTMIGDDARTFNRRVTKAILRIVLAAALILLVPLLAMQFTEEVAWDLFDFVVAGALLVGTGLMYVIFTWKVSQVRYRAAIGLALAVALLLVWLELAVGIFGSEDSSAESSAAAGVLGAGVALSRAYDRPLRSVVRP